MAFRRLVCDVGVDTPHTSLNMGLLQTYLLAYNAISLAGWTYVFAATAAYGTAATWGVVVWLQYLATLELAHATLGLV